MRLAAIVPMNGTSNKVYGVISFWKIYSSLKVPIYFVTASNSLRKQEECTLSMTIFVAPCVPVMRRRCMMIWRRCPRASIPFRHTGPHRNAREASPTNRLLCLLEHRSPVQPCVMLICRAALLTLCSCGAEGGQVLVGCLLYRPQWSRALCC